MGVIVAAALVVGLPTAAGAQAPVPPTTVAGQQPAKPNTWALSPTGADPTKPSNRTFFSYELAKSSSAEDSVTLWNQSDGELTFDVYARDAFTTVDGGFDLQPAAQKPNDVGSWIALEQNKVVVPARSGLPISFKVNVPANATPGDHAGGIVASISRTGGEAEGKQVVVDHRIGSRVYLRVPGALNPALVIDRLESEYRGSAGSLGGSDLIVTYTVSNAGNTRMRARQVLAVQGLIGWPRDEATLEDLPELLPGASVTRTHRFEGVRPAVRLTSELVLTPYALTATREAGETFEPVSRSTSVWAVPWPLLVTFALLLGLWRWRIRRRRAAGRGGASPVAAEGPIALDEAAEDGVDAAEADTDSGAHTDSLSV